MFHITRDAEGRADTLRVRLDGFGLRGRLRGLSASMLGKMSAAKGVGPSTRMIARGVRTSIPHMSYRRDEAGQISAIVLRFGIDIPEQGERAAPVVRARWARARHAFSAFRSAATAWVPRPALDRDAWGRVTAVRVGAGVAAGVVDADVDERVPTWVIEPARAGFAAQAQEFWRHRKTLWHFSQRNIRRMYKGTRLGVLWLFARPLLPIFITTVVLGRLLGVPSDGVPYFLFFLAGTASWMLFERSVQWATRSLDLHKSLIKKVYFPRLIVPISSIAPAAVDGLSYMGLLVVACVYYFVHDGHWYLHIGPSLLFALLAALLSVVLAIGVGLWTAVWQTRAREVRYTLGYVMRFWNYLTPVMYPLSEIPPKYRWLMFLNPMAPVVETFKWGVLGIGEFNVRALGCGVVVVFLTLLSGIWYFNRSEAVAVDRM